MRCQDDFYNTFLQQCREGVLDQDVYAFVHGLPTSLVGSADVVTKEVVCGQDSCVLLQRETWRDMFLQGKVEQSRTLDRMTHVFFVVLL